MRPGVAGGADGGKPCRRRIVAELQVGEDTNQTQTTPFWGEERGTGGFRKAQRGGRAQGGK